MQESTGVVETGTRFFGSEAMFLYDYHTLEILDVNDTACSRYGVSPEEFRSMKITDLGEKYVPSESSGQLPVSVWKHRKACGESFFVQFTHQQIKYNGRTAQLAVAHDVTRLMENLSNRLHLMPKVDTMRASLPIATIEWDQNGRIRDWSDGATQIFGRSFSEIIGKNLFEADLMPEHLRDEARKKVMGFLNRSRSYFMIEADHTTKEGETIYCMWHNAAVYDQSGKLLSIFSMVEDITEKKEAEIRLKQSEERFRVLSDGSLVGIFMLQDEVFRYVNPRFCEIFGYLEDELLLKKDFLDLVHPEDCHILRKLREQWRSREIDSFEEDVRMEDKNGQLYHIRIYASKIFLDGDPALIGVIVDRTKQVEATQKYKTSVDSYRDLFDSIGDSIFIHDSTGMFTEVNRTALETFGFDRRELIGHGPEVIAAPGKVDMEQSYDYLDKAMNGEPQLFEWWARKKNGEIFPTEIRLTPGTYFGEKGVIAIVRDITEQYEKKEELRISEEFFRQLFQNAPVGIALLDENQNVQRVNRAFESIFGYTFEELEGEQVDAMIAPDDRIEEARELSARTEPFEFTTIRQTKAGRNIDVLIYGVPVVVDGKTRAIYGIYVDITERMAAQEKIRQSLDEKVVLLSEIHHRVKNNLAVITGLLELQYQSTDSSSAQKVLLDSQLRVNSMALIHEKLYQHETLSSINFDSYIKDLTGVIEDSHNRGQNSVALDINAERVQLAITQAIPCGLILNEILTNTYKHAFPKHFEGDPRISITMLRNRDNRILMRIEDNGVGLPDDFEKVNRSSLGMTLISTLSRQLEAKMDVRNEKGTCFEFVFRREEPMAAN